MSVGASAVLRSHPQWVLNVDVSDHGVLNDVDVPEDYRKLFGRDPL
jgi:CTP:molybdopterin cytidylyltransferase MocA